MHIIMSEADYNALQSVLLFNDKCNTILKLFQILLLISQMQYYTSVMWTKLALGTFENLMEKLENSE